MMANSRHVGTWIAQDGAGAETIEVFRRALGDELVLMYMGFADATGVVDLEESLSSLRAHRSALARELDALAMQREGNVSDTSPAAPAGRGESAAASAGFGTAVSRRIARELEEGGRRLVKIDKQIAARARALPLFKAVVQSDDLTPALRSQRQHPVHTLLRRIYHEGRVR
jgi:hypothetical protein